jgi:ribonucleoside-diphosphate reductase alpha chain
MAKEGSTISGLMDSFATLMSVALQHGVPLQVMTEKLAHTRFEPSGWTGNEKMGYAKSPMDYLGRWMQHRFLEGEQLALFTLLSKPTADIAESNRCRRLQPRTTAMRRRAACVAH